MRILRLDLADRTIELHPYVSVVRGLAPEARAQLLEALRSMPAGHAEVGGLLEAHGVLLDLDPDTLALLDLPVDLDIVVRADDVPLAGADERQRAVAEAEEALARARTDAARAEQVLAAARQALEAARSGARDGLDGQVAELDDRRAARAEAEAELDAADRALTEARRDLEDAERVAATARRERSEVLRSVRAAATALEHAVERRDPIAVTAFLAAQERLAEASRAVALARDGANATADAEVGAAAAPTTDAPAALDPAAVESERAEVEARLLALEAPDPLPVRLALEQVRGARATELVPSPEATALADAWARTEIELEQAVADDDPADDRDGGDRRAAAARRVREAELTVANGEVALRGTRVSSEDIAVLDAAHEAVLAAKEAASRRLGGAKALVRLTDAQAKEDELLEKLGFVTYADFQIRGGRLVAGETESSPTDLDDARRELADAERELAAIDAGVAAELRRAELLARRRALKAQAVVLLEHDPGDGELEAALRRVRVPATAVGEHVERLRSALTAAGLDVDDEDVPERTLVELAKVWLKEHDHLDAQRNELNARLARLEAQSTLDGAIDADAGVAPEPSDPLAVAVAVEDQARTVLDAARARHDRHVAAERDVEARRQDLEDVAELEERAVEAVAAAEAEVVAAAARQQAAADRVEEAGRRLEVARGQEAGAQRLLEDLQHRVAAARDEGVSRLEQDVASVGDAVAAARRDVEAAEAEVERRRIAPASSSTADPYGTTAGADDAEWYLLARLAAQRSVSFAGSLPLVLDDALLGLEAADAELVLGRLERMAAAVQVVVVTEDLNTAAWAENLGLDRAAVVDA